MQEPKVGIRQFENTAIAKLEAQGVPSHIAKAFVHHGLPKSGKVDGLKPIVCAMKFEKFFSERSAADFRDPFRVGALVPTIHESRLQKFHTEFAMNDIEATKFIKSFPEFDVIARGRVYNQHSFYANKRYAECELLVSRVFRHAARSGLDPRKLVDLGGNATWHAKRKRDYVHCDNPVLSPRDVARYTVRDVFGSASDTTVCRDKFSTCGVHADYAIGVHSTYDVSPKAIAASMAKRSVRVFFGIINYIPGIEQKPAGMYESDGITMEVCRPTRGHAYVRCGFRHDPSLEYTHKLNVLKHYLHTDRLYEFVATDGTVRAYKYSIVSTRGTSLHFSVELTSSRLLTEGPVWTPRASGVYFVSLRFLGLDKAPVDAEFFDRLVLQAASARSLDDYDIVALFRYAKSLRQRVSINGIVLSSGYSNSPEELVNFTIAAFAIAAAFRGESSEFFRKASSQVVSLRGSWFFRDVVMLSAAALGAVVAVPFSALLRNTGLRALDEKLKAMAVSQSGVVVEMYKPHAGHGRSYNSLVVDDRRLSSVVAAIGAGLPHEEGSSFESFDVRSTVVMCGDDRYVFRSGGIPVLDPYETPTDTSRPIYYDCSVGAFSSSGPLTTKSSRAECHAAVALKLGLFKYGETASKVMSNGDRMFDVTRSAASNVVRGLLDPHSTMVPVEPAYVVFRGYGNKAVTLTRPPMYAKGKCLRFLLFYTDRVKYSDVLRYKSKRQDAEAFPAELPAEVPIPEEDGGTGLDIWETFPEKEDVEDLVVKRFDSTEEGRQFVHSSMDEGKFYMSGALDSEPLPSPPPSRGGRSSGSSRALPPYVPAEPPGSLPSVFLEDSPTEFFDAQVSHSVDAQREDEAASSSRSDELVPGRDSILEQIELCDRSRDVAVATSKALIDMAVTVAHHDAPLSKWEVVSRAHPGNPRVVRVDGSVWNDFVSDEPVEHMAVSDGVSVYDKITNPPPDGVYVTSDVMAIYTGASIRQSLDSVKDDKYSCPTIGVNGVAGCGKSYEILHSAGEDDVVLCETRASLADLSAGLAKRGKWKGHAYTVDSFLMRPPVRTCDVLYLDESYRLHAAKIHGVIKILRPNKVYAFGDNKQIPVYPFVPGMDFRFNVFTFLSTQIKRVSYRMPADVAFALSVPQYYGFHVSTNNPIMRSVGKPEQYYEGALQSIGRDAQLLVYSHTCKDDLLKLGLKGVLTVGESQGKTFDHVVLFRDKDLNKQIYFDRFQALVAFTRHRRSFRYITASAIGGDSSAVAGLLGYVASRASEILLASHVSDGVVPVADWMALRRRDESSGSFGATPPVRSWADDLSDDNWDGNSLNTGVVSLDSNSVL